MSVQAGEGMYCEPRSDTGPYTEVEVGYPSESDPLLLPFAEDKSAPTETVYGWVPKSVVLAVVAKHGGIVSGGMPDGFYMNKFIEA